MKRLTILVGCLIILCAQPTRWAAHERATPAAAAANLSAEPLKVTASLLDASAARARVSDADGWLGRLVVEAENTSGKVISYLSVEVNVPGSPTPLVLGYGRIPGLKLSTGASEPLRPGAKVRLNVKQNSCPGAHDFDASADENLKTTGALHNERAHRRAGGAHAVEAKFGGRGGATLAGATAAGQPLNNTADAAEEEITTDFIPLVHNQLAPVESGHLVRVEMPRAALARFGLPVNAERAYERVKADVLVGDDGIARAIRFVR